MPTLERAPNEQELKKLISIYLKAETDIIQEIGRLRSRGLVDYHAVAALERVQAILQKMESDCWEYVPRMIEKQFYVRVPEARKILESVEKHTAGYENAAALTGEQTAIVDRLTMQLMGEITDAAGTALSTLQRVILGRTEPDLFRRIGLERGKPQCPRIRGGAPPGGRDRIHGSGRPEVEPPHLLLHGHAHHIQTSGDPCGPDR